MERLERITERLKEEGLWNEVWADNIHDIETSEQVDELINGNLYTFVTFKIIESTNEQYMDAIREHGEALEAVENPTDGMIDAAISSYGQAIGWILPEQQTKERCEAAIRQNAYSIYYIDNKTIDLCRLAYDREPKSWDYFPDKIKKMIP